MFVNISLWLSIGIDNKRIRIEISISLNLWKFDQMSNIVNPTQRRSKSDHKNV